MTRIGRRPLAARPTAEEIAAVRADPDLSPKGKAHKLQALYQAAAPQLDPPTDRPDPRIRGN